VADELPPQQANQIRQLLNERANADTYGQTTRVEAVDKQLAELGYKTQKQAERAASAAEGRAATTVESGASAEPKGRATRQQQQTTAESGKQ
jgi:hypothetical protein